MGFERSEWDLLPKNLYLHGAIPLVFIDQTKGCGQITLGFSPASHYMWGRLGGKTVLCFPTLTSPSVPFSRRHPPIEASAPGLEVVWVLTRFKERLVRDSGYQRGFQKGLVGTTIGS